MDKYTYQYTSFSMQHILQKAAKQPGFIAVFTFATGLICITLLCLGVGAYAAIWEKTMPLKMDSPLSENQEQPTNKDTNSTVIRSCQQTCALEFNYCKFTQKEADVVCTTKNETCTDACPVQNETPEDKEAFFDRVDESIAYGPTPLVACQGDRLYPVNPRASYIILTRPMFRDTLRPFIRAKQVAGEQVETVEIDSFLCSEPGNDIPEKIRHYLGRASEAIVGLKGLPKVLIVGAPERLQRSGIGGGFLNTNLAARGIELESAWEIPMRYYGRMAGDIPIPTDQYYASLTPTWNTDINNTGSLDAWAMDFDFQVNFLVGRVPTRTTTELRNWINTTLAWHTPTAFTESTFQSTLCYNRTPRGEDVWEDRSTHRVISHACQMDEGGDIAAYVNREMPDLVTSYSHGIVTGITNDPTPNGYTLTVDSPGFTKPPIMFVHGCEVGGVDYDEQSLAESYIGRPNGVVAFIGSTRSHWDSRFPFPQSVFNKGYLTLGEAFYQTKISVVKDNYLSNKLVDNLFMFSLYGDPGLKIVEPTVKVTVTPRNNIIHVAAQRVAEPFSVPVTIRSSANETLRGGLRYQYNDEPNPVTIASHTTVSTILRGSSTDPRLPLTPVQLRDQFLFPNPRTIQLSPYFATDRACDTSLMSCIASQILIAPPLHLSCARIERTFGIVEGIRVETEKKAKVKIISRSTTLAPGAVTLILKLKPGSYVSPMEEVDRNNPDTATEVARQEIPAPEAGRVYEFRYTSNPTSTPYSGERTGYSYNPPRYFVVALNSRGEHVGLCRYSFELDTEGVGI